MPPTEPKEYPTTRGSSRKVGVSVDDGRSEVRQRLEDAIQALPAEHRPLAYGVLDLSTEERHDAIATLYTDDRARRLAELLIEAEHDALVRDVLRAELYRLG